MDTPPTIASRPSLIAALLGGVSAARLALQQRREPDAIRPGELQQETILIGLQHDLAHYWAHQHTTLGFAVMISRAAEALGRLDMHARLCGGLEVMQLIELAAPEEWRDFRPMQPTAAALTWVGFAWLAASLSEAVAAGADREGSLEKVRSLVDALSLYPGSALPLAELREVDTLLGDIAGIDVEAVIAEARARAEPPRSPPVMHSGVVH